MSKVRQTVAGSHWLRTPDTAQTSSIVTGNDCPARQRTTRTRASVARTCAADRRLMAQSNRSCSSFIWNFAVHWLHQRRSGSAPDPQGIFRETSSREAPETPPSGGPLLNQTRGREESGGNGRGATSGKKFDVRGRNRNGHWLGQFNPGLRGNHRLSQGRHIHLTAVQQRRRAMMPALVGIMMKRMMKLRRGAEREREQEQQ